MMNAVKIIVSGYNDQNFPDFWRAYITRKEVDFDDDDDVPNMASMKIWMKYLGEDLRNNYGVDIIYHDKDSGYFTFDFKEIIFTELGYIKFVLEYS